ncbi:MAG: DUF3095 domain-containing protein [Flavobacterium sp.]|uniref:DUF3095 domain-containing protein n=1 Tax=Flavobacterium sp. TaxID=239 RepID=UPI001226DAB6|nr:DUF3095 domain-containing protein [Flavobacterium sp.]RZJ68678.1 MAG: DUF3095 domain-containing protein [Flavobacterium sp.]
MENATNEQFYTNLQPNKMRLGELLVRDELFHDFPIDWTVIITDIKNSTQAVFGGQHENVNLLATGSIVTVLNIAYKDNITIPFFFGGDGATFLVPPSLCEKALRALSLFRENTLANFNLEIRVGQVPVRQIVESGNKLRISKFHNSKVFSIPVILGDGLIYAEKIIKGSDYPAEDFAPPESDLDLSGMQCRWDHISPPENKEEIVTLLVIANDEAKQPKIFSRIMDKLDEVYGNGQARQPISVTKLRLKTTFGKLRAEMRVKLGKIKLFELLREKIISWYAYIYFRTIKGKKYLERLVDMSDTLVLDGKINTVISGNAKQRKKLERFLEQLEASGDILFGMHMSQASVMSCYVRDLEDGHIHFVDGAEGGYTSAARVLKAKLAK